MPLILAACLHSWEMYLNMGLARTKKLFSTHSSRLNVRWIGLQKPGLWVSVWLFILSSSLVLLWSGYTLGEREGLFLGLIASVFLNLLVFIFGESNLIQFFSAEQVRGQDPWGLQDSLVNLSETIGMNVPTVYVFEHNSANGFTIGIPWKPSAIGLSTALLNKLNQQERHAVLGYLLIQINQSETFLYGVTTILVNALSGMAASIDRFWPVNFFFDKKQRPFLFLLSPLIWVLIKMVRTSKSYLKIDALACEILEDRKILAEVFWRLQGLAETCPMAIPPCSSHHFIVNPESQKRSFFYEKTHPPMKHRLEKLVGYYPI
jgi:heat shock protein HtpX